VLGTIAETCDNIGKDPSEIDDKNQIEDRFISSQVFHRTPGGHVREITAGAQLEPRILESFGLVTRELYRLLPATIHTQSSR
jgi:hypothetical protein